MPDRGSFGAPHRNGLLLPILEKSPDGILILDQDGTILFANPAVALMMERGAGDLRGAAFGYPLVLDATSEIQVLQADAAPITVEMRVTDLTWSGRPACLAMLRDVSDARRARLELSRALERLELATSGTGVAVWEWTDINDPTSFWFSPDVLRLLGLGPGGIDLDRETLLAMVAAPDRKRLRAAAKEALKQGQATSVFRARAQRGRDRVFLVRGRRAPGLDGDAVRLVGTLEDITEFKKTEWSLRSQLKEQHCLFEVAALASRRDLTEDALFRGVVALLVPAFRYPDIARARIVHQERSIATPGFSTSPWLLASELHVGHTSEGRVEVCYMDARPAGDEGPFLAEERAMLDAVAALLGQAILAHRTEETLRNSRDLLGLVIENVPIRVFWKDAELRYLGCNSLFARDAGMSCPEDLVGKDDFEMGWREQAEEYRADDRRVMDSDTPYLGFEEPQTTPDGQTIWLRSSKVPLHDAGGGVFGVLGIYDDITESKRAGSRLRLQATALEAADNAIVITDAHGMVHWCNPAFLAASQRTEAEVIGKTPGQLVRSDSQDQDFYRIMWETITAGRVWHGRLINRRKDGDLYPVDLTITPLKEEEGRITHFIGIEQDVTEKTLADQRIQRLSRIHAMLSAINSLIVRVQDQENLYWEACRIACTTGQFRRAWIGLVDHPAELIVPTAWHESSASDGRDSPAAVPVSADAGAHGLIASAVRGRRPMMANNVESEHQGARGGGEPDGYRSLAALPLSIADRVVSVLVLYSDRPGFFDDQEMRLLSDLASDISFALDHIHKSRKLDYLAHYDPLTGLANRTLFLQRVNQHIRVTAPRGDRFAVVKVDIEHLGAINTSLGHSAGDELLTKIAKRLSGYFTPIGVGRTTSDLFTVLVPFSDKLDVMRSVRMMAQDCFGEPYSVGGSDFKVGIKTGIALFPDDGADAEVLLGHAIAALREGKKSGEPFAFFTKDLIGRSSSDLTLEHELREALETDAFVLHYQPKLSLDTGKISGVEALIRWRSAKLGLVPPNQFIPLLEETGLILDVGKWALKRAVRDHRRWAEAGLQTRVAVNVSPLQLRQPDFVRNVRESLTGGVSPTGIDVEITESLIMTDVRANVRKLNEVRRLGANIAIDDFGTGHSSLAYLAKLPVQSLKIDRTFIADMLDDADTMSLVSAIVSLAHSLRLTVVAEGVETEDQARALRLLRCEEMQGYLFSRPVPFDEMTALLMKNADLEPTRDFDFDPNGGA